MKADIQDRTFSDPVDFNAYVMAQKSSYFNSAHPCAGKFPKKWNSWEEAMQDVLTNGIKEPIRVKSVDTPSGKKYRIVGNTMLLAAAILAGMDGFLATEAN